MVKADEVMLICAPAAFTCWVTVFEVEPALLLSPLYIALMECEPTARVLVLHCAVPPLNATAEQMAVVPSSKVTVPVGEFPLLNVAVKVTFWPKVLGLAPLAREITGVVGGVQGTV